MTVTQLHIKYVLIWCIGMYLIDLDVYHVIYLPAHNEKYVLNLDFCVSQMLNCP